jgi:hypothetical protein
MLFSLHLKASETLNSLTLNKFNARFISREVAGRGLLCLCLNPPPCSHDEGEQDVSCPYRSLKLHDLLNSVCESNCDNYCPLGCVSTYLANYKMSQPIRQ